MAIALIVATSACGGENGWGLGIPGTAVGPGRLGGSVLKDDQGVDGVRVVLVGRDSTLTDSNGDYLFTDLAPSFYTVILRLPAGEMLESGQSTIRNAHVGSGGTTRVDWTFNSSTAGVP